MTPSVAPLLSRAVGSTCVALDAFDREPDRLTYRFMVGASPFSISIWYEGVDFNALERRFGLEFMRRIYFHIAAFNANQFISTAPARIDFGEFARFADAPFEELWRAIFDGAWAQWRYENHLPHYRGPEFALAPTTGDPVTYAEAGRSLLFSGGGKDSVVAQAALAAAGERYDTLTYSHSVYGTPRFQFELTAKVLQFGTQGAQRRISVFDDFLDSPILERGEYDAATMLAAETPASIFMSLPLALTSGYDTFVLGHERNADFANLVWDETGEPINHQWGKSLEAETLLSRYIGNRLLQGFHLYSVLKPFADPAIFALAATQPDALRHAHSCNLRQPWCERCTKCAYVWISYRAYLPEAFVTGIFQHDLLSLPENRVSFRELLGFGPHRVFDCVGMPEETRLAFELCRRAGMRGGAMADFEAAQFDESYEHLLAQGFSVDDAMAVNIPDRVWRKVRPWAARQLAAAAEPLAEILRR
jgi:hypothetical protein